MRLIETTHYYKVQVLLLAQSLFKWLSIFKGKCRRRKGKRVKGRRRKIKKTYYNDINYRSKNIWNSRGSL